MAIFVNVPRGIDRVTAAVQRYARLVFFGTPRFAVPSLRALARAGWPIAMVVTAPDKAVGRHAALEPSPVRRAADELGLPVRTPETLKDDAFWREFNEVRPELCVVVAYAKLIPARYLAIPRLGFVNVHPSLLPAYRGPSPIQTAILDGCDATGVSLMVLDEEMDHGPVLAQRPWAIPSGFDAAACAAELADVGAELLTSTLPGYVAGTVTAAPQDHSSATFTHKFSRPDGRLDWNRSVRRVMDRIRALAAEPGTWTTWQGKALNIIAAHPGAASSGTPGSVAMIGRDVAVSCQDAYLVVEQVQPEGGKVMDARAFVNGHPEFIGSEVG